MSKLTELRTELENLQGEIDRENAEIDKLVEAVSKKGARVLAIKETLEIAEEAVKEDREDAAKTIEEAFSTLCIQQESGSLTTSDLLTFAKTISIECPLEPEAEEESDPEIHEAATG